MDIVARKPTPTQRAVLQALTHGWIDLYPIRGRRGKIMYVLCTQDSHRWRLHPDEEHLNARTAETLLARGWIAARPGDVMQWRLTDAGRAALEATPDA